MFLILSAAYVGQELQSEFGKIPPAFLPLGNRRLFEHQIKLAPVGVSAHLSIPESYVVSMRDLKLLDKLKVTIIRIPDGISIGASVVAALNLSANDLSSPLHILYGDTLFTELPEGDDLVCVSAPSDSYNWAVVTGDKLRWLQDSNCKFDSGGKNVVNGYFKFSSPRQLMRSITQTNWDFLDGLNRYHQDIGFTTIYSDQWLDFGHVNTYYRSKAHFTTQRAFNELTINSEWIEKSSAKNTKIAAESNWFSKLPAPLRVYTPQYLGSVESDGRVSYRLEYLHQTALNELYVFGDLPVSIWEQILSSCIRFLKACKEQKASINDSSNKLSELFNVKTVSRLQEYCNEYNISIEDEWCFNQEINISLKRILEKTEKYLPDENSQFPPSILHGDFCFSNILYDFRAARIKTIDPRGTLANGEFSLYGDVRYDIAKLSHSIIGLYDWIIAGYYDVKILDRRINFHIEESKHHKLIQQRFIELIKNEFNIDFLPLLAMQIQLFLSMLPLHNDDVYRQQALFANAFRLYSLMEKQIK